MVFLSLLNNITLLVSLSVVHTLIMRRWKRDTLIAQVFAGLLFGGVVIIAMLNPLKVAEGVFFDGRSIIISIAGLFCGPLTAIITALIGCGYRIWLGGTGTLVSVLVIGESTLLGIAYYYLRHRYPRMVHPFYLYLFSVLVHIFMLLLAMTLPGGIGAEIIQNIALPVITLYPLASLIMSLYFLEQEKHLNAQDILRANEEQYRLLIQNQGEGLGVVDIEDRFVFTNPAAEALFGVQPGGLNQRSLYDFLTPSQKLIVDNENVVRKRGGISSYELEIKRPDGTNCTLLVTATPQFDSQGHFNGSFGVFRNITERKENEEILRVSEERYRLLFENLPQGFALHEIILDQQGVPCDYRFLEVNPAFETLTGLKAANLVGKTVKEVLPNTEQYWIDIYGKVTQSGEPTDFVNYSQELGKYFETHTFRPRLGQFAVIFSDISQRRCTEEALRVSELQLRATLDSISDLLYVLDSDLCFVQYNTAFEQWLHTLGVSGSVLGRPLYDVFPAFFEKFRTDYERLFRDGKFQVSDEESIIAGRLLFTETRRIPIFEGEKVVRVITIVRDVTEKKKVEESTHRFYQNLEVINTAVSELVAETEEANIYHIIAEAVHHILPQAFLIVSSVIGDGKIIRIVDALGFDKYIDMIRKILKIDPFAIDFPIKDIIPRDLEIYRSGKLTGFEEGLYAIGFRKIPRPICGALEKMLGVGSVYAIGFAWSGRHYGGLTLLLPQGQHIEHVEAIETIIHQASIAIQRKRVESALRESDYKLNMVMDNIPALISYLDARARFLYVNRRYAEFYERGPEEFIGKHASEIIGKEAYAVAAPNIEQVLAGKPVAYENIVTRGGRQRVLSVSIVPHLDENGLVSDFFSQIIDITEQKEAEQALRESEARFQMLVEAAPDAIFVQTKGCFAYLNSAAVKLFNAGSSQVLLGKPVVERYPPDFRETIKERIRLVNDEKKKAAPLEEIILQMDGSEVYAEVIAVPLHYQGQDGALVFARDISDRKNMERLMIEEEKLAGIGTLAAGIAHEINTPLQIITGISESTQEHLLGDNRIPMEHIARNFKAINDNAWRIAAIVRSLLDYARSTSGETAPCSINELVHKTLLLIEHQLKSWSSITVKTELSEELPLVHVNTNQITQVLINLLGNARDAMPRGGQINISTEFEPENEQVVFRISDTGCGIAEENITRIFNPFFTTKPVGQGTGLGLSIAASIIRAHGGEIELEATSKKGSVFKISLPVYNPALNYGKKEDNLGRY